MDGAKTTSSATAAVCAGNLFYQCGSYSLSPTRMFQKYGVSTLRDVSETMYRQFGVRVAILAGYCDGEGDPTIML
jgi:hypothetical protein